MKTTFFQNVKLLRKEKHLTQEQLAEAMGVTASAIYKWEQDLSIPDIGIIMELASFFGVSVDALIGYEVCPSDKERILHSVEQIRFEKSYQNHWDEIDGWLRRYPNDFDIVYNCGVLYGTAGIETNQNDLILHSITLMNHACTLIDQNRNPEISETYIKRDIGVDYLVIGEVQKGLELLKAHNPCGLNNDIIGQTLAENMPYRQPEQALFYLSKALIWNTASLYRIVIGYFNLFYAKKDYRSAIELLEWIIAYHDGLIKEESVSYLDKNQSLLLILCGTLYAKVGDISKTRTYLSRAHQSALKFDTAPDYTSRNIRYCENLTPKVSSDNIGVTAMDAVVFFLQDESDTVLKLWEEICHEE